MICPFCRGEMESGTILGDGRCRVGWEADAQKLSKTALFFATYPKLTAADYGFAYFRIRSQYCPRCKKMIFDTEIEP